MKIAYIMSRFPLLSETFILREMDEIENRGGEIYLFPLICQEEAVNHAEVERWMNKRHCIPYLNLEILKCMGRTLLRNPLKFLVVFFSIIIWNITSPKFLSRALLLFPKAILTAEKIKSENVDHIHVHYASHPALVAFIIHQFTGISYSITIHSHDIYDNHVMLKQKLGSAKFLVTISNFNVAYLINLLGDWIKEKIYVIHCGVNLSDYIPTKVELYSDPQLFKIIQIGSLHWKKGQTYLLRAIKLLESDLDNFQVQIIGDGPERKKLEKMISDLGLSKKVHLLGAKTQAEVRILLPTADCYLQTSVSEGIPVALMEALACELPVISTKITGIPELIINGKTGILVAPKNEQAIANAIKFILANPTLANQFGQAGRAHVEENFNLQKNVSTLYNLFRTKIGT